MKSALVQEVCDELIDKVFNEILSQLFQDLTARKVSKEFSADFLPFDMRQRKKVASSAVGELSRIKDETDKS